MADLNTNQKWRPGFGDIVTVGALVAAAVMWLKQPIWEWSLSVTAILIALVIFTAIRHQSHPIRRAIVAAITVVILIWAAKDPVWNIFHHDYPNVIFTWPVAFNRPLRNVPSSEPPATPVRVIPAPAPVPPPIKKYPGEIAAALIKTLHKDEDLIARLNGIIQPAVNFFDPRFLRDNLRVTNMPPPLNPQELYQARLKNRLDQLNNVQSGINLTREEIIQIHNALGASISKEISYIPSSLDYPALGSVLLEYRNTLSLIRDASTDRNTAIMILEPINQRFHDALVAYVHQVDTTLRDIQTRRDEISRNVITP